MFFVSVCLFSCTHSSSTAISLLSLHDALPILPTTYSGSEMTPIYGVTDRGVKTTGRDPRVLPQAVVYDPALTLTLPPRSEEHTSELQSLRHLVCRLLLEKKNKNKHKESVLIIK